MTEESRTSKSLKNSIIALSFFAIEFILKFYSRKIFLDYLGYDILGLNTTAVNLMQFLNLAELGIGAAVGFSLYKPIYDKDFNAINDIISLQGIIYKRIGIFVIACALVLMCFFPLIFKKITLPIWYAYASFAVVLLSALLSYFVNYKQIILSASQLDYKIQYGYKSWIILKVACQMVAVALLSDPYVWWLILEALFAIIASCSLEIITRRSFTFLEKSSKKYKDLKDAYPIILRKVKQVFFHKIGAFALTQTSPLIIYAYLSLKVVTFYGNYMVIVTGLISLFNAVFNSMTGGIGNLVAEGDKDKILKVFKELFSVRFLIISTICFGMIILTKPFIALWIGEEYILPESSLYLMIAMMYIMLSRSTVDGFISAYGLYGDIWAPIVEAILNIGLSILLGYYYGLNGILSGVVISQFLIIFCWKPYYLFRFGINQSLNYYCLIYLKNISIFIISCFVAYYLSNLFKWVYHSIFNFIIQGCSICAIFLCLSSTLSYIFRSGFELFINRIKLLKK